MGKMTAAQIAAGNALVRKIKNDGLTGMEKSFSSDPRCRASNHLASTMGTWVNGIRVREEINADGSKMSLQQQIKFREDKGYGDPKTIDKLKAKLAGDGQDKLAKMSDADLLKQLSEAPTPSAPAH